MVYIRNAFRTLMVEPTASLDEISQAYHAIVQRFHPKQNPNPGAAVYLREATTAYNLLRNKEQPQQYDEHAHLQIDLNYSKRIFPVRNEPQMVHVLVEITPAVELPSNYYTPLNLTLVIDRSKSMTGERLDWVKTATHQIIDQLYERDSLSVVVFSDRAEVIIQAETVTDKYHLKGMINTIAASGGTEIYQGLAAGMRLIETHNSPERVNHLLVLTDGQTYDDENLSLALADQASADGISISGIGIGEEWNDTFLDTLTARTGGSCTYISSPKSVVKVMNTWVRNLRAAIVERLMMLIAPDAGTCLDYAFRLTPNPQPFDLPMQPLRLGTLERHQSIQILLQLKLSANLEAQIHPLLRLQLSGDILPPHVYGYTMINDLSIKVDPNPPGYIPSKKVIDAIRKVTLYRAQERAQQAVEHGNYQEASHRLGHLALQFLEAGQKALAQTALMESVQVLHTGQLSESGRKILRFKTRVLPIIPEPNIEDN